MYLFGSITVLASVALASLHPRQVPVNSCPGYKLGIYEAAPNAIYAELSLAGSPCNVYGKDIQNLILNVIYETGQLFGAIGRAHLIRKQISDCTSRSLIAIRSFTRSLMECSFVHLEATVLL